MAFHNYTRRDLYNVTTERVLSVRLKIKARRRFLFFGKKTFWVREYARYECIGEHHAYMGQFAFVEEEYTGWEKSFATEKEAENYINLRNRS